MELTAAQKEMFDTLYWELKGSAEHDAIYSKNQSLIRSDDEYHALVMNIVLGNVRLPIDGVTWTKLRNILEAA